MVSTYSTYMMYYDILNILLRLLRAPGVRGVGQLLNSDSI